MQVVGTLGARRPTERQLSDSRTYGWQDVRFIPEARLRRPAPGPRWRNVEGSTGGRQRMGTGSARRRDGPLSGAGRAAIIVAVRATAGGRRGPAVTTGSRALTIRTGGRREGPGGQLHHGSRRVARPATREGVTSRHPAAFRSRCRARCAAAPSGWTRQITPVAPAPSPTQVHIPPSYRVVAPYRHTRPAQPVRQSACPGVGRHGGVGWSGSGLGVPRQLPTRPSRRVSDVDQPPPRPVIITLNRCGSAPPSARPRAASGAAGSTAVRGRYGRTHEHADRVRG